MPKVLLTRPSYETVTRYLYAFSQKLIKFADEYKWTVFDLKKTAATLRKFTALININSLDLVLLHGHGNYSSITCQNEEILLEKGKNEHLLKDTRTYAFSCETGKELGPAAIKKGAKSYIGYDEVFVFYQTEGQENYPLKDKRAGQFLEPAFEVSYSLLRKSSPKTAYRNSQKAFKKNIDSLISSKSKELYLVRYLLWDMRHQVCLES
ncbi:hypothetical protein A3D05_01785 [Candidatus Gottesmanbacteria bacterium RIFCSPHIGHO2_02_FULL_40_24]|uniref:Uncharacterized protein n=1 Tax=Candidatus Gottesmanbacteria bacterium RIFCSPHIGHO2_01_FULL_40_15 TaxID=1798376 RepID=A0A1F5Z4S2_9BACT|nr:MAG: hypothetical protein A2777_04850 [Candidatus Gottesmanbacteria bacterium RIFCSPHIGHO2_01_FULL_40_15]OGG18590.1 MAG: hypothetical protein A3D05_01785 [Candidatus Gottesmanbacteria bacterium RIFCSPHIGHO2_02_FULL_40_24]OGG25916.1 MAG: hypothetical protein A3E42_03725 [Candidatus Gottesmanbacteria bacterium RIFCSPHIGHO2_12_FULL_40_13]OGG33853.1 MAG: hypothetical protein A3I80_04080 [Candidatus Gottesmanbacteria bacterium RIFCSPLOWO2_02_FULL_40_10]